MSSYISGLASGIDWTSMIDQLLAIERRPITLMESDKEKIDQRYSAWTSVNSKLLSLKSAAESLTELDDFNVFASNASIVGTSKTVDALLNFAVGSNASQGSYTIEIENLAQAQKLGSKSFSSLTAALGLEGDLLINGNAVHIESSDTIIDIRDRINGLNSGTSPSGVMASVFTVSEGEYRLTLTSAQTGSQGIDISNASTSDLLGQLGIADTSESIHNPIAGGAQTSFFESSTLDIKTLLNLSSSQSGNITIAGESISIDLSSDSLQSIRDRINANGHLEDLGISASIVAHADSGETTYSLQIDGTQNLVDADHILQTLGLLRQGHADVRGLTGDVVNTVNGAVIRNETLITDIDGYNSWTLGDRILILGTDHDGLYVGEAEAETPGIFTISQSSTIGDLLTAIEDLYGNEISAYVNADGAIVVEDNRAGESDLSLALTAEISDVNSDLDFGTFENSSIRKREITAGEDAEIILDGVDITKSSNLIDDVIPGLTLDLKGEDEDAVITLNIDRDYDGIKDKISDYVNAYNDVMTYVNEQFTYDEETKETPALFGDASLLSVKGNIRDVILSEVAGLDSSLNFVSLIGINIDNDGLFSIDDSLLDSYLRTNFSDVVSLFVAQGTSSNSNLSYIGSSRNTAADSYEIEITQLATQAGVTGSGFSGSLNEDATITITDDSDRVAQIELSADWNISAIVNAINSELSETYNEILVGENIYYADEAQSEVISADTFWQDVYDADGNSAGLEDGDVIEFSGTTRYGTEVSGSYAIDDITSDGIGGLLGAIEDVFGSDYDAYIDDSGRIAIKDTKTGDSDITLSIDALGNLDFGAIDVDPSGSDGSQEGRGQLYVSAANEDGQLKIYNDSYGDSSFSISVSGGNLGIVDDTYSGSDVAGRIRSDGSDEWMTMSGNGQVLKVDEGQDAEDLSVKYTGASLNTFDFVFTTGIGEKMDRALFYMTDPYEGYVAGKQDALQSQMERIDQKIETVERRLELREEILINQFVTMERLVSQLQYQQQWLGSQLDSLGN